MSKATVKNAVEDAYFKFSQICIPFFEAQSEPKSQSMSHCSQ